MPNESSNSRTSSFHSVPAAIWVALAVLAAATAGLGGALVMHSRDQAAVPTHTAMNTPSPAPETSIAGAGPAQPTGVAGSFAAQPQPPAPAQPQAQALAQPQPLAPAPSNQFAPAQAGLMPAAPTQPAPVARRPAPAPAPAPVHERLAQAQRAPICTTCGTVESVRSVKEKGQGSGIGVAGGAVTGGLLGHQVGGGSGKTALTVLGALGGAFAGNEVEKRVRATTVYDVQVRMDDGSVRTIRRGAPIAEGTQVRVEGNTLRIAQRPANARPRDLGVATGG